jgi:modulator of FtsH protease HflK
VQAAQEGARQMTWNQGGGSGGGGGGGPWGGGKSPWGGGGRGPRPPNLEEIFRRSQDRMRRLLPGGWGSGPSILFVLIAVVVIWGLSGFYRVEPNEEGVVLRFGAFNRVATPGLNYHLPPPIESVLTPKVTDINVIDVGFRPNPGATNARGRAQGSSEVPEESLMLTGDENIVDINFTVFWRIKDAQNYLFKIRNPELTVKAAAESAMREVIGSIAIARAFAEGRGQIETDTQRLLQHILDSYESGIEITQVQLQKVDPPAPVLDAFRDVQSAKIDLNTLVNNAQAYSNDILPRAHGDAVRIVQEAEAYRQQVLLQAQGDAARFLSVYQSYKAAEDVTARRLYIETMESVLKGANKVILDKAASGVVPYLPLPGLHPGSQAAPAPATPAPGGAQSSPAGRSQQ